MVFHNVLFVFLRITGKELNMSAEPIDLLKAKLDEVNQQKEVKAKELYKAQNEYLQLE